MKKRAIVFLMILCMLASSLVFAGGEAEAGERKQSVKKSELLLWLPPFGTGDSLDMDFWTTALQPWAEEHNVNLNIEITPWGGYEEKYLTGFASGQGPDVGYMYLEMFNDFIEMGTLEDVDRFFTQEEKDNYIYWDQGTIKGGQYALPFIVGNPRIPFFNMDILEKAGITELPVTWNELVDCLVAIKEADLPDVMPFAQEWADPAIGALNNIFYPYLWQAGGDIYNEDGTKVALDENDAAVRAAQFLYDLRFKHQVLTEESLALSGNAVREAFIKGRIAVASMDARSGEQLSEAGIDWQFLPSFEDKTRAIWVASDSLVMNSASENKELAASLMKYITSAPVMESFHKTIATFPPISKDEAYNDNPAFKDMFDNDYMYFKTLPVAEGAFKVMDVLYKNLQLMMLGDLSPEKAIGNTVDYSKSVLGN
ncbi:MAG: sugar ABC transporter substrate-binding protein [Sphaerochaeta sp.]